MKLMLYQYRATVERVIDGDTVDLLVDLGFGIQALKRFRLAGIDTAELNSQDPEERGLAQKARDRAKELMPDGATVWVSSRKVKGRKRSFGRWHAEVFLDSYCIQSIGAILLAESLASEW